MRKFEVKIKWLIIPTLLFFDFIYVNDNLIEQKQH